MIGKRVQEVRDCLNMSRKSFGERFYVSQDVINNIERERITPTDNHINGICKTYNVNEHWLRTGEGEMFNASEPVSLDALAAQYGLDDLNRIIVEEFIKMPAGARETYLGFVHAVAERVRAADYAKASPEEVALNILKDDVFSEMKRADTAEEQLRAE